MEVKSGGGGVWKEPSADAGNIQYHFFYHLHECTLHTLYLLPTLKQVLKRI